MNKIKNKIRGSVALISVLIISAVLIILVLAMSEANFLTSSQYVNNYNSQITYSYGEGCLEELIIRLEDDPALVELQVDVNESTACAMTLVNDLVDPTIKIVTLTVTYKEYSQNYTANVRITTVNGVNNARLLKWTES